MRAIKHKHVYMLLLVLALFRAIPYLPLDIPIKFLRIWPDGTSGFHRPVLLDYCEKPCLSLMADSHMTNLTRSELLVVYISLLAATVLVSLFKPQGLKKTILPFALPVVLIIVYGWFNPYFVKDPYHGRFNLALLGLKAAAYRMFTFMEYMGKELEPENPPVTLSQMKDLIYLDIVKYNTTWFAYSVVENFFRYLTHEVQNTNIMLYDGKDDFVIQNWVLYTAPGIDAQSEKRKPYYLCIAAFSRCIDFTITRKVLQPFFFVSFVTTSRRVIKNFRGRVAIGDAPQDYLMFLS